MHLESCFQDMDLKIHILLVPTWHTTTSSLCPDPLSSRQVSRAGLQIGGGGDSWERGGLAETRGEIPSSRSLTSDLCTFLAPATLKLLSLL